MKKFLVLAAAVLLLINLPSAFATEVPGEVWVFDDELMPGSIIDALPLPDGLLVLGSSEYSDNGWMAYINEDGSTRWLLYEEGLGVFSCAAALDGGGFSALINRYAKYDNFGNMTGTDDSLLAKVDNDGKIIETVPLPHNTEWLIYHAGGYYAIGTSFDGVTSGIKGTKAAQARLTRLDGAGGTLWALAYSNPSYSSMTFKKGVIAANSLILIGDAYYTEQKAGVGLIHRADLDGQMLWTTEAALGIDTSISDICVSPEGLIVGCYADVQYDEEMGFPVGRKGSVFCLDMEGGSLWEHMLEDGLMADYVMPFSGGFLVGSRGLDLENCPMQGFGWLKMLDKAGNAIASDSTPDISGGKLELMGMSKNLAGQSLLYGALLIEPGFPDAPFLTRLEIPAGE